MEAMKYYMHYIYRRIFVQVDEDFRNSAVFALRSELSPRSLEI